MYIVSNVFDKTPMCSVTPPDQSGSNIQQCCAIKGVIITLSVAAYLQHPVHQEKSMFA